MTTHKVYKPQLVCKILQCSLAISITSIPKTKNIPNKKQSGFASFNPPYKSYHTFMVSYYLNKM